MRNTVGSEADVHHCGFGLVDIDVAGGGPVLGAVGGVLEGEVAGRAVVKANKMVDL